MKNYIQFLNENINPNDPFGEEDWNDKNDNDDNKWEMAYRYQGQILTKVQIRNIIRDKALLFFEKNPERNSFYDGGIRFTRDDFMNESHKDIDPYDEEIWDNQVNPDLYVIYVIGQDQNFLTMKKRRMIQNRFYEYYYTIATLYHDDIHFNGSASVRESYPTENPEKVLDGTQLVGYITGMNNVRFKTLQELCDIMHVSINSINFVR